MTRWSMLAVAASQVCGVWAAIGQLPPTPPRSEQLVGPQPRLQVIVRQHELGSLTEGDKVPVKWLLENRGDADLVISRTQSSCGCTVVQLAEEDKTIPPGRRLELTAEFDTQNRRGEQKKNVKVYSNDPREPELTVGFHATVAGVYDIDPPGIVNLRTVVRGTTAEREIILAPAENFKNVEITSLTFEKGLGLSYSVEPARDKPGGKRIRFQVPETTALGTIAGQLEMSLSVDGLERTRTVPLRGEVVGEIVWLPKVLDASRQTLTDGRRLASVTVRSAEEAAFEVLQATAGDLFDVAIEQLSAPPSRTAYAIYLTVRNGAPWGPFGTMLHVRTDSLDQPLITVPVFGIIEPKLAADPAVVVLRPDGTDAGARRRVRLSSVPSFDLEVGEVVCDHPGVSVRVDSDATPGPRHVVMLTAALRETNVTATDATITVTTNVAGMEQFKIPCRIVPRP